MKNRSKEITRRSTTPIKPHPPKEKLQKEDKK